MEQPVAIGALGMQFGQQRLAGVEGGAQRLEESRGHARRLVEGGRSLAKGPRRRERWTLGRMETAKRFPPTNW
ncbi:hypothetical protein D3C76_782950 [compost metagenome]